MKEFSILQLVRSSMKISSVLICFCLRAIISANNVETYHQTPDQRFLSLDAIIFQIFEMVKWLIKNGSPDIFPVLDPMELNNRTIQISLPDKLLTINANFTNGLLKGLGDFDVLKVEFIKSDIAVDLSINFPLLTITADEYEMEGDIYDAIPLTGYGSFEFQMANFNFWSKIYLKQSEDGESAIIDKLENSEFSIEKISSHTEFDKNIDDIFNALIEDLLAYNLTRFSKLLLMKYSGAALEILNPFLDQFETWNIIAAIL